MPLVGRAPRVKLYLSGDGEGDGGFWTEELEEHPVVVLRRQFASES